MKTPFLEALASRCLVGDGATGTQLQLLGLPPGMGGEAWNLERPEAVRTLHARYRSAGADLLTTNSFGGSRLTLAAHGWADRTMEINRAAARIAAAVAGDSAWVLGDIGPCGGMLEPYGETLPETALAAFGEQAAALLEGGADAILVETMSDPHEAMLAAQAAREAGAPAVIVTFAFQKSAQGFRTMMGATVANAVDAARRGGAHVVGANCGTELSLTDYALLTRELAAAAGPCRVIVQPNAGTPVLEAGRAVYRMTGAAFAAAAPGFIDAGARIVGGCCGSAPEHIAAVAAALKRPH